MSDEYISSLWQSAVTKNSQKILGLLPKETNQFVKQCKNDVMREYTADKHSKQAINIGGNTCRAIKHDGNRCNYTVGIGKDFCQRHKGEHQRNGVYDSSTNEDNSMPDIRDMIGSSLFSGFKVYCDN